MFLDRPVFGKFNFLFLNKIETKNQFARDDPAFVVLLSAFLISNYEQNFETKFLFRVELCLLCRDYIYCLSGVQHSAHSSHRVKLH